MPERVLAYVGLGSNLQTPEQQLRQALDELARIPRTRLVAQSGLYRNPPMGPVAQPDFVNAAAALETQLPALELLDELQAIEQAHGRVRIERWGRARWTWTYCCTATTALKNRACASPIRACMNGRSCCILLPKSLRN